MRFSWDSRKSEANLVERGLNNPFSSDWMAGETMERVAFWPVGVAQGIHLTVAYTDRFVPGQDIERRIISARRSNRRERKAYSEASAGR